MICHVLGVRRCVRNRRQLGAADRERSTCKTVVSERGGPGTADDIPIFGIEEAHVFALFVGGLALMPHTVELTGRPIEVCSTCLIFLGITESK